jgi:hypothetical protein
MTALDAAVTAGACFDTAGGDRHDSAAGERASGAIAAVRFRARSLVPEQ